MTSREKYLERQRRYNASPKGRARWLKYSRSEKGRDSKCRQITMSAGGIKFYVGTAPTIADADGLKAKIADFRAGQLAEYREFAATLEGASA
jgi:hypothetical protein